MPYDHPWYMHRKLLALPSSARQTALPRCAQVLSMALTVWSFCRTTNTLSRPMTDWKKSPGSGICDSWQRNSYERANPLHLKFEDCRITVDAAINLAPLKRNHLLDLNGLQLHAEISSRNAPRRGIRRSTPGRIDNINLNCSGSAWRDLGCDTGTQSRDNGMKFGKLRFGSITIDGATYEHDVVIDRGRIRKREKKQTTGLIGAGTRMKKNSAHI